ncbi:MAG: NADH-quinone oxidoreductase subunit H [Candidatus Heimdallarchaeota archaeon]|nr:NADH-quinone oxidoreductase subunit H [Candidatus Heimdallarchaeota archaeon]
MLYELSQFILFPGALFLVVISVITMWWVRRVTARMEDRIGPPFLQPLYDFAKLLAKERVYPDGGSRLIQHWFPVVQFIVAMLMGFFLPIFSDEGLISFEGDIFFFIFLLGIHGSAVFFIGWVSRNPYAQSGAGRAVMIEMSLEIPLSLSIAGIAIMTKTMRIADMTKAMSYELITIENGASLILLIPWVLLFLNTIVASMGALELNPFSAGHAETEIVAGWMTELTGPDLALVKLSEFINLFNLSALIVCIFLGGPTVLDLENTFLVGLIAFILFLVKLLVIVFIIAFIKTLSSRLRVDQTTSALWKYLLPVSMIGVLLVLLIDEYGGVM